MVILKIDNKEIFKVLTHQILIDYLVAQGGWYETQDPEFPNTAIYKKETLGPCVWIPKKPHHPDYANCMSEAFESIAKYQEKTSIFLVTEVLQFGVNAKNGNANPELTRLLDILRYNMQSTKLKPGDKLHYLADGALTEFVVTAAAEDSYSITHACSAGPVENRYKVKQGDGGLAKQREGVELIITNWKEYMAGVEWSLTAAHDTLQTLQKILSSIQNEETTEEK